MRGVLRQGSGMRRRLCRLPVRVLPGLRYGALPRQAALPATADAPARRGARKGHRRQDKRAGGHPGKARLPERRAKDSADGRGGGAQAPRTARDNVRRGRAIRRILRHARTCRRAGGPAVQLHAVDELAGGNGARHSGDRRRRGRLLPLHRRKGAKADN